LIKYKSIRILILALLLTGHFKLIAQFQKIEQSTYFQSRIDNPIKVEVFDRNGKYQFVAYNRSLYPYQLELNFKAVSNLRPSLTSGTYVLMPGRTNLITLSIVDNERSCRYDYSVKYRIGLPSENVDFDFPYLIPVNKNFELFYDFHDSTKYFIDCFKMTRGDTVFNMRKGYITAVPKMYHSTDRISNDSALEILHDDGTIMIYKNIEPDSLFVKAGQMVFPMQALGVINCKEVLELGLFMIEANGRTRNLKINYCISENSTKKFSSTLMGKTIVHPRKIITLEMTKRNKKRYQKKTLYK
jgi:hypothetical protein